jgi:hypothetical protein
MPGGIPGGNYIPPGIPPPMAYSIPGGGIIPPGGIIPEAPICCIIAAMSMFGGGPIRAGVKFLIVLFLLANEPVELSDCSFIMLLIIYEGLSL